MEHLLAAWPHIAHKIKDANHVLLLSDYDGTLTPIVEHPEQANLSPEMKQLIQDLACQRHFTVGIISGRALADLQNKVGISGIIYAGNHGFEIVGPGVNFVNPLAEEMRPLLRIIQQVLTVTLGGIKGIFIENKGLTLSVHYRKVEKNEEKHVARLLDNTMGNMEDMGKIKISNGKKVYEIKPDVKWDKGKAIKLLMKKYGKGGRHSSLLPIYLGDDTTDEDGFNVINKYQQGISVFVGEEKQNSVAQYYLKSPAEVATYLSMLLKQVRRGLK